MSEETLEERLSNVSAKIKSLLASQSIVELSLHYILDGTLPEDIRNAIPDVILAKRKNLDASSDFVYKLLQMQVVRALTKQIQHVTLKTEKDLLELTTNKNAFPKYLYSQLKQSTDTSKDPLSYGLVRRLIDVRNHFDKKSKHEEQWVDKLDELPFNGGLDRYKMSAKNKKSQFSFYRTKSTVSIAKKIARQFAEETVRLTKVGDDLTKYTAHALFSKFRTSFIENISLLDLKGFTFVSPKSVDLSTAEGKEDYIKHDIQKFKNFAASSEALNLAYLSQRDNYYVSNVRDMDGEQAYVSPSLSSINYSFLVLPFPDLVDLNSKMHIRQKLSKAEYEKLISKGEHNPSYNLIVDENADSGIKEYYLEKETDVLSDLAVSMHLQGSKAYLNSRLGKAAHTIYDYRKSVREEELLQSLSPDQIVDYRIQLMALIELFSRE